ncbi:Ig-like domain-containing protein [Pseudophaeobacter sp. EL27]|uniref:Ig-like domain-containing protein n=1 Tax=Pseudophaeobacter sp. EL27 TaxID=2107580 RepID=UPI000EFCD7E6|nr:Ig-like domain-containing protein [Pseudophaeobacter sp. EL27]
MSTVGFITRDLSGTTRQSTFSEGSPSLLNVTHSKDISLNLSASDIDAYVRRGSDLHLVLADGQILVLQNYYTNGTAGGKNLFLSEEGNFVEVVLEDKAEGALFASYEPLDISGKWSAYDEMVFLDVDRIEPVIAPLAAPLFGGLGAAGAAAGVAGAAVVAGGGGGGGGGGNAIIPTVDNPDASYPIAGATTDPVVITGTGTPGAVVEVNVGGETQTGTVKDDGTWEVTFPVVSLPADGNYDTTVKVVDPNGTTHDLDGPTVVIDTTPPVLNVTSGTQSTGDIVNGSEHSSGTVITGSGEAGASVSVVINGHTQTTTVAPNGSWSVTFDSTQITTGEYTTGVAITTTDDFGNSASYTETLVVDTVAPPIGINTVEGDNIVSFSEASNGVTLSGTGEAGASISVLFQGVTQTTTVANNGTWSVDYSSAQITGGNNYASTVEVTSSDLAGNSSTSTHTVHIDTQTSATLNGGFAGPDDVLSGAEAQGGVQLTGTAEPGSTVQVFFGASGAQNATVDAAGNWTVLIPQSSIPTGTTNVDIEVHATDAVGNTDVVTRSLAIDTEVDPFTVEANQTANDVINQDELNAGFALQGTVEPGSEVIVTIRGVAKTATVDAAGNWSAEFSGADLPAGEYSTSATIVAKDPAGNTSTLTENFEIDTVFEAPVLDSVTYEIGSQDVSEITVEGIAGAGESITVNTLEGDGSTSNPGAVVTPGRGVTEFDFTNAIPDGTDLVVTNVDTLGNGSSTLLVLEDNATTASTLNHASLGQFNIDELDLGAASNVSLVLTEADIKALSENSDTLTIHSGSTPGDDTVTVAGATLSGTRSVGGENYNVYTVGNDGTTLVIDQDVTVII